MNPTQPTKQYAARQYKPMRFKTEQERRQYMRELFSRRWYDKTLPTTTAQ